MGKTQTGKKSPAKTPPSRAAKTWRSPPYHSTNERKRGSGPVGRGGKVLVDKQSGGKGKQSGGYTLSSSSASGSDAESESNNEGKHHHGLVRKKDNHLARRTIDNAEGERAEDQETTDGIGLHEDQVMSKQEEPA